MSDKFKRCYNCDFGNKSDKESLEVCKDCGLPYQRKNWKPLFFNNKKKKALYIIKELLAHCRYMKVMISEESPTLNGNITMAEEFLKEMEKLEGLGTTEDQLAKATELLKKVIKFTWGEGWNYSLDVKVEAEQFLKECEK